MKRIFTIIVFFICTTSHYAYGDVIDSDSVRLKKIEQKLTIAAENDNVYLKEVDMSIGRISLSELLRNIAKVASVNLSVKGGDHIMVSINFSRAVIKDVLYFLCKEYTLDIDVVGNIVSVYPLEVPPPAPKDIIVSYDTENNLLGFDLSGDNLIDVVKKITEKSQNNIILPTQLHMIRVSGYVDSLPFDQAIEALGDINNLVAEKNKNGVWEFRILNSDDGGYARKNIRYAPEELSIDSLGLITARINNRAIQDVLTELCERQSLNYYFLNQINGSTSIYVNNVDLFSLIDVMLAGTNVAYYIENSVIVFGVSQGNVSITSYQIVPLKSRSIANISTLIPSAIQKGVEIKPFPDLNSIIISGDQKQVSRVANFIKSIDKRVPMVTIDVMILDVKKSTIREAGIEMGIGGEAVKTQGKLMAGIDMTLSSQSVNNLINSLNGFGAVNLGKVTPNFYMTLKLLEDNGDVELRSTPKLSTINGHEATLTSGETQYYKEITNNYLGGGIGQPTLTENYVWRSIDANLSIKITPHVSVDSNITLEIEIEQTEFTGKNEPDAPPGTTTRSFKSIINVEDGDIVLLGGLDRHLSEKSSSGLPFLARIPVIKWLFGKTKDNKVDHKLNILIKPTVTY